MRVLLTGATGLIGTALRHRLVARGDTVFAHTRKPRAPLAQVQWLEGDAAMPATFVRAMGEVDAVINLAGSSIARVWTRSARQQIVDSRLHTTHALVEACRKAGARPQRWLNASAVGFYGAHAPNQCDESSPRGTGFLADVCAAWEAACEPLVGLEVPLHRMRLGVVLAREGGMLASMRTATNSFLGGPLGDGQQWVSWIHLQDAVQMFLWALDGQAPVGAINACAPNATHQAELTSRLGQLLKKPVWLRAPALPLRWALGQMADEVLLGGQNAVPKAALSGGFGYDFPALEGALRNLLR